MRLFLLESSMLHALAPLSFALSTTKSGVEDPELSAAVFLPLFCSSIASVLECDAIQTAFPSCELHRTWPGSFPFITLGAFPVRVAAVHLVSTCLIASPRSIALLAIAHVAAVVDLDVPTCLLADVPSLLALRCARSFVLSGISIG